MNKTFVGQNILIHCYKHDGSIHRCWDKGLVLEETPHHFIVVNNRTLVTEADEPKNYKIFRQIFNKKMEKVIAPVFFRLQKAWEEKLFDTQIEQFTDNEQCVFHLKNKKQDSILRIVYPGFAKIVIYINHEGLDSPENKEIQLSLTKISQKELITIVEDLIKDFKYTSA